MNEKRRFRGPLSIDQAIEGIRAAHRNAKRLAQDARHLLNLGRHATAAALATLSAEEDMKKQILVMIALEPNNSDRKKLWESFGKHKWKTQYLSLGLAMERMPSGSMADIAAAALESHHENADRFDRVKEDALYVDCLEGPIWTEPGLTVAAADAERLVRWAEAWSVGEDPPEIAYLTRPTKLGVPPRMAEAVRKFWSHR